MLRVDLLVEEVAGGVDSSSSSNKDEAIVFFSGLVDVGLLKRLPVTAEGAGKVSKPSSKRPPVRDTDEGLGNAWLVA